MYACPLDAGPLPSPFLLTDLSENSTSFDREVELLNVRESVWTSIKLFLAEISRLELTSRLLFGPGLQDGSGNEVNEGDAPTESQEEDDRTCKH